MPVMTEGNGSGGSGERSPLAGRAACRAAPPGLCLADRASDTDVGNRRVRLVESSQHPNTLPPRSQPVLDRDRGKNEMMGAGWYIRVGAFYSIGWEKPGNNRNLNHFKAAPARP